VAATPGAARGKRANTVKAEAHRCLEGGRTRGKLLLRVRQ
jgi:hypothetical protein